MALMARAGLTADERLAVMDVLGELNDYLASAAIYAKGGTALAEFLQVCLSDSVGIWPAAVADAHLETQLPDALATAAAKLDVQIRMHFPRLSETGLQRL
ncbi:MAG TPA: hypothetical protein PJ982_17955 [Lacipirellulaceae bacterium]|nr:hypothetical protein [Lacipirellulaceae bacterium]